MEWKFYSEGSRQLTIDPQSDCQVLLSEVELNWHNRLY